MCKKIQQKPSKSCSRQSPVSSLAIIRAAARVFAHHFSARSNLPFTQFSKLVRILLLQLQQEGLINKKTTIIGLIYLLRFQKYQSKKLWNRALWKQQLVACLRLANKHLYDVPHTSLFTKIAQVENQFVNQFQNIFVIEENTALDVSLGLYSQYMLLLSQDNKQRQDFQEKQDSLSRTETSST